MPKRVALHDHVQIDTQDLSNFARSVRLTSDHAQIDVSGFSASGANEYIAGATTQSVAVEFYGSYGTAEVHQTLYPLHKNRTVCALHWRPDMGSPVGPANPELQGNAMIYNYGPGSVRGDTDTFEVVFQPADAAGFAFVTA
jgi:hypothetical protein